MMNWWHFPPQTKEVQFDEKWSFVGKKEKRCEEGEEKKGDNWDHVALDPVSRLVISVVPGKRTAENVEKLMKDFKKRTNGRLMDLMVSDEYRPYKGAILEAYGEEIKPEQTGKRGRPRKGEKVASKELKYAVVHKTRENGKVVKVDLRVVFGGEEEVKAVLLTSPVSKTINTAFIERQNGTDRNRNARKVRKTYCFSKDWEMHEAATYFTMYSYNFCWPVRTLREKVGTETYNKRTPAMMAGLSNHVWTMQEWATFPVKT